MMEKIDLKEFNPSPRIFGSGPGNVHYRDQAIATL
jgi:hypothetical protein